MDTPSTQFNASLLHKICGGTLHHNWGDGHGFEIHTSRITKGHVFIALNGEKAKGASFLPQAFKAGAVGAIVGEQDLPSNMDSLGPFLVVPDAYQALLKIAAYCRSRFKGPVVAITGSVGKTSLKEMLSLALSSSFKGYASGGNFNNHIGLPLCLANLDLAAEVGIFELGMSAPGEISTLTSLVRPNLAVITEVAAAHSVNFADLKDIFKAKLEIIEGLEDYQGVGVSHSALRRSFPSAFKKTLVFNQGNEFAPAAEEICEAKGINFVTFAPLPQSLLQKSSVAKNAKPRVTSDGASSEGARGSQPISKEAEFLYLGSVVKVQAPKLSCLEKPGAAAQTSPHSQGLSGFSSLPQSGGALTPWDHAKMAPQGATQPINQGSLVHNLTEEIEQLSCPYGYLVVDQQVKGSFGGQQLEFGLPSLYEHKALLAVVALGVARLLGADVKRAAQAMSKYQEPPGRGRLTSLYVPPRGWHNPTDKAKAQPRWALLLDDSYNASPISMQKGLEALGRSDLPKVGKILVVGDMLELQNPAAEHAKIVTIINLLKPQAVFTLGAHFKEAAKDISADIEVSSFLDHRVLAEKLTYYIIDHDMMFLVFFKGSYSSQVHQVVEAVQAWGKKHKLS